MSELIKQAEEVKSKLTSIKNIDRFMLELRRADLLGVPDTYSIVSRSSIQVELNDTMRADLMHLFVSYKLQLEKELKELLQG